MQSLNRGGNLSLALHQAAVYCDPPCIAEWGGLLGALESTGYGFIILQTEAFFFY